MTDHRINTVAEMIEWLSQFPGDMLIEVSRGRYFDSMVAPRRVVDEKFGVNGETFEYEAPRAAWTYVPTPEAVSRGQVEKTFAAHPGVVRLGTECDD